MINSLFLPSWVSYPVQDLQQLFSAENQFSGMSQSAILSFYDILSITKFVVILKSCWFFKANQIIRLTLNDVTTKVVFGNLVDYFNNKICFLYTYKIRFWSLPSHQSGVYQVNIAQNSTLLHSYVLNEPAKFSTKIFANFWGIMIFVLGHFILNHPVCLACDTIL